MPLLIYIYTEYIFSINLILKFIYIIRILIKIAKNSPRVHLRNMCNITWMYLAPVSMEVNVNAITSWSEMLLGLWQGCRAGRKYGKLTHGFVSNCHVRCHSWDKKQRPCQLLTCSTAQNADTFKWFSESARLCRVSQENLLNWWGRWRL